MKSLSFSVPGKWVLAGEHTVLRGGKAIALPHPDFRLDFFFEPGPEILRVEPEMANLPVQDLLRVARAWLQERGMEMEWPKGVIRLQTSIPFGAGLGSSAAFSVALARFVLLAFGLEPRLEISLARAMEDRFHGKSSGMDVSVVSLDRPILFSMEDGARVLEIPRLPPFRFFDTGLRASTRDCIERVEQFRARDPSLARELDAAMMRATELAYEGLRTGSPARIVESMELSSATFATWGLVPKEAGDRMAALRAEGYRGLRLTGAGMGGYLVGLA